MTGVSVLTLAKGRDDHLANLVEGLRRSARPPDELIVVDMNETAIAPIEADWPVHIHRLGGEALPLAAARNLAANAARRDALLFLDVDCIPARRLVGDMASALDAHDALVCAEVLYLGPGDARAEWREDELLTAGAAHAARPFPRHGLVREDNPGLFWSLAFGVRRDRFMALGGFDEAFTGYGAEDTDLGFRAHRSQAPLMLMAGPGAFHQHHPIEDPPTRHLADIVRNARVFRDRWGVWPMLGWLEDFERMGLIAMHDQTIEMLTR